MIRVDDLPDDPQLLKRLLAEQQRAAAEQIAALKQQHEAELAAIFRRSYGPRSERFDPAQLLLFGVQVDTMPLDEDSIAEESGQPKARNRHAHGRGKLPGDLPRTRIEYDLPKAEKVCPSNSSSSPHRCTCFSTYDSGMLAGIANKRVGLRRSPLRSRCRSRSRRDCPAPGSSPTSSPASSPIICPCIALSASTHAMV
jgi:hypothetical protein